jgi:alkylhydroperoxidase family enzyme
MRSVDGATSPAAAALEAGGHTLHMDPHMQPFLEAWLDTFIFKGRIDARLRELAILRIMWRCRQPYEWGQHYRFARQAGASREDVVAIRTASPDQDLEGAVAIVIRAADEVVDDGAVGASTLDALESVFDDDAFVDEFLHVVAGYRMFATLGASRREPMPLTHAAWPPDGIGPEPTHERSTP